MSWFRQKLRDKRGVAAVEFGLMFPAVILLIGGVVEMSNVYRVANRVWASTQTVADQIARQKCVTSAQLDDLVIGVALVMYPFEEDRVSIDVASIGHEEADGDASVIWREQLTGAEASNLTLMDEYGDMIRPEAGLIFAFISYDYTPVFNIFDGSFPISHQAVFRPRRSAFVPLGQCDVGGDDVVS